MDNVGTPAASLTTYLAAQAFQPDLAISLGTAGGFKAKGAAIGSVFIGTATVNHDRRIPLPVCISGSFSDFPRILPLSAPIPGWNADQQSWPLGMPGHLQLTMQPSPAYIMLGHLHPGGRQRFKAQGSARCLRRKRINLTSSTVAPAYACPDRPVDGLLCILPSTLTLPLP